MTQEGVAEATTGRAVMVVMVKMVKGGVAKVGTVPASVARAEEVVKAREIVVVEVLVAAEEGAKAPDSEVVMEVEAETEEVEKAAM